MAISQKNNNMVLRILRRCISLLRERLQKRRLASRFITKEATKVAESSFQFSPLRSHIRLIENIHPKCSYQGGDVKHWQREAKLKLWELLGRIVPANPITEHLLWTAEDAAAYYKKIIIETNTGDWMPVYRCQPKKRREPDKWVICLQGHTSGMHVSLALDQESETKRIDVAGDRNFVDWCLENGYGAYCLEVRSLGTRGESLQEKSSPHPCEDAAMRSLLLGQTLMGERVSDIAMLVTYIKNSENCHSKAIGIMGNSLGGTLGIYASALVDEISFTIAGSCVSSFRDSIFSIYHCTDLCIPNILSHFEFGDIIGLSAPKPILIAQAVNDRIFPINGLRSAFKQGRKIYTTMGTPKNIRLLVGFSGHRFYGQLASSACTELFNH